MNKFSKIIKKHWHWLIIIPLAIAFFIGTSSFNYYTQEYSKDGDFVKWVSPDETANYIFAKLMGQEGRISFEEEYNRYTGDIMRPRSVRSDHGELKPVSFLGIIIIYGTLVSWTSYKILPFLTPFFGSTAIIYFYLLVKKLFGRHNALLSALMLAILPAFLYYSARSMFHNVLFVSLLIISMYYIVSMVGKKKASILPWTKEFWQINVLKINWYTYLWAALGGATMGLAIMVRTSELLWILPFLGFLWLVNIRQVGLTKLLIFISFMGFALLPMLYYNQILFSSPYLGGYPEMNQSIINIKDDSASLLSATLGAQIGFVKNNIKNIFNTIFHFGYNPEQSAKMLYYYFVDMFSWLFWLMVLGLLVIIAKGKILKKKYLVYITSWLLFSSILILYYGSWQFFDNPDKAAHTIGNSYTRYWLPIYIGAIPIASFFIIKLTLAVCAFFRHGQNNLEKIKTVLAWRTKQKQYCLFTFRVIIISVIAVFSVRFVLFGSAEGLYFTTQRQVASQNEWHKILELTETNSTVITRYHDKLLFPERKVIVGLFDDKNMIQQYANLVNYLPVYYYNFTFPEKDINYLNERRLKEFGLGIEVVDEITEDFTLYRLKKSIIIEDNTDNVEIQLDN